MVVAPLNKKRELSFTITFFNSRITISSPFGAVMVAWLPLRLHSGWTLEIQTKYTNETISFVREDWRNVVCEHHLTDH